MRLSNPRFFAPFAACALAALAVAPAAWAENKERPRPTLKLETGYVGDTDLEVGGVPAGELAVTRHTIGVDLPLKPLSDADFLSAGLDYSGFFLDRGMAAPLPDRLESISARLSWRKVLDENWALLTSVSPGLHFAAGDISGDAFGVGVFFLASRRLGENLSVGVGFAYESLSETNPFIPVAGVRWAFAESWRFDLAFPSTRLSYTVNDRLTLRASLDLDVGSFYVEHDPRSGPLTGPKLGDTILDYTAISTGLGADYRLTDNLTLSGTLGYNFSRVADYDERSYELEAKEGAPTARLGLAYAF